MARWLELAPTGSTKYSTGTRIAASAAGGAMVLATLVATTGPATASQAPTLSPVLSADDNGTLSRDLSVAAPVAVDAPVVVGLIVDYAGSSDRLAQVAGAAGALGRSANVTVRGEGNGVVTFDEPTDVASATKVLDTVAQLPGVTGVDLNILHTPAVAPPGGAPSDPYFGALHGLWDQRDSMTFTTSNGQSHTVKLPAGGYGTKAPAFWGLTKGSNKITVAVIDTGRRAHADLDGNTVAGYDMISNHGPIDSRDGNGRDADPSDEGDWVTGYNECFPGSEPLEASTWHGTHVAGTVAASNDSYGVVGNAPGVRIQHVRVLGKCGGSTIDIADGITWASGGKVSGLPKNATPAKILNLSLGGPGACQAVTQKAINGARKRGSVVIVAAGNNGQDARSFQPANCKNVITVGATDFLGTRTSYSNYGSTLDLSAPGGAIADWNAWEAGIYSTLNDGATTPGAPAWAYYQGTSMATPAVAGVAALIASLRPKLSAAQLEKAIRGSVSKFPNQTALGSYNCVENKVCGKGLIDAKKAATAWWAKPKVTNAQVGKKAKVSTPIVATSGSFKYQWLRNGKKIKGATKKTYTVKKSDLGKKLSVKVTAAVAGFPSSSAKSGKVKMVKQTPTVKAKLPKKTVKKSKRAKVVVTVNVGSLTKKPTGTLKVTYGKKSKTYKLSAAKKGKLVVRLPKLKKGKYKIKVTYTPSSTLKKYVKTKTSKAVTLRIK